jgi:hypothetical protein
MQRLLEHGGFINGVAHHTRQKGIPMTRSEREKRTPIKDRLFHVLHYINHGRWGYYLSGAGEALVSRALDEGKDVLALLYEELTETDEQREARRAKQRELEAEKQAAIAADAARRKQEADEWFRKVEEERKQAKV